MAIWNKCGSRGGGGGQGVRTPSGNSQVIWVSIGNKQLDPLEKVGPPSPGKCWTPSGTLKNDRVLSNWQFDFCKISWGLKKKNKKKTSELFLSDWPGPPPPEENSWIRACETFDVIQVIICAVSRCAKYEHGGILDPWYEHPLQNRWPKIQWKIFLQV